MDCATDAVEALCMADSTIIPAITTASMLLLSEANTWIASRGSAGADFFSIATRGGNAPESHHHC